MMWVNVPGAYRCKIVREGFTCTSKVINVEMKTKSGSCINLYMDIFITICHTKY